MVPAGVPGGRSRGEPETPDTWTLELEGRPPLEFEPGQFNMLCAVGVGEVPISISGDPDDARAARAHGPRRRRGHGGDLRAEPGGCSACAARSAPWPSDAIEGADVVIVAGGIGLAPLRPAILPLLAGASATGGSSCSTAAARPGPPVTPTS